MRSWCLTATVICLIGSGIHGFEIEPEHHPQSQHGLRDKVVNVRAGGFLKNSNLTDYAREHLSRIAKSKRLSQSPTVTQANYPTPATPIASESAIQRAPELVLQHTYPEQAVMVPTLNSPAAALSVPQPVAHAAPIGSTATHVLSPVISVQTPSPLQTPTVLPSSNTFEFAPSPVIPLPLAPATTPQVYRGNSARFAPSVTPYSPSILQPTNTFNARSATSVRRPRREIRRNRATRAR